MTDPRLKQVTLEGRLTRLEPLTMDHLTGLLPVACEPDLWRHVPSRIASADDLADYIRHAEADFHAGTALPFAIRHRPSGVLVGSTRLGNIALQHDRVEIGWTWIGRPWRRTGLNRESKLLLLQHAFDELGCERVEFKTDVLNEQSRAALLGIGAVEEGVLRKHMVISAGFRRDTVYYSILRSEWPNVRQRLIASIG
jgi:N-acetyltransferase